MLPSNIAELTAILGLDEAELKRLAAMAHSLYSRFYRRKPSGGYRLIEAPFKNLKQCQRILTDKVLDSLPLHPAIHGRPGTSQITAAAQHLDQSSIIVIDLKNFFPSVRSKNVKAALVRAGFTAEIADIVTRLCTSRNRLPQGAPTSPVLAQLVVSPVLTRIEGLLEAMSSRSRFALYVDDLSISGPIGLKRSIGVISQIFAESGLIVNDLKTKVMAGSAYREVLGIEVGHRLEVGRKFKEKLNEARKGSLEPAKLKGLLNWQHSVTAANGF